MNQIKIKVVIDPTISVASDLLRRLADGMDTQIADAFLDGLFALAGQFDSVRCDLIDKEVLRLQFPGAVLQDAEVARAKTKFRMLCARLAVRCSEWGKRAVAPYGDVVELVFPPTKQQFKVRFENTTTVQEIVIELQSGNGAPKTA